MSKFDILTKYITILVKFEQSFVLSDGNEIKMVMEVRFYE